MKRSNVVSHCYVNLAVRHFRVCKRTKFNLMDNCQAGKFTVDYHFVQSLFLIVKRRKVSIANLMSRWLTFIVESAMKYTEVRTLLT